MRYRKRVWILVLGVAATLLSSFTVYHLLFGRLFPWSPLKPGYREIHCARATLILPKEGSIPEELSDLDAIVEDAEAFHKLTFPRKVRIILPRSHSSHTRLSGVTAAACAYQTGTEVFLSLERMRQVGRRPDEMLKHELSHAILFQNASLRNSFRIPEWLREGLAVYYGNPHDNYTGEEFTEMAVDSGYLFDLLNPEKDLGRIPREHRYGFLHSEYRCFVEYLVDRFGEDALISCAKELTSDPGQEEVAFRKVMGTALSDAAQEFYRQVKAKRWPPAAQRHRAEGD